jgi:CRP-like cAMP-binding protein
MLESLSPLIKNSVKRKYSPGGTIFYQGEVPRSACIILKGTIRVFSISAQGDEQIISYHDQGEFVPASWIFGKSAGSLFFYEAVDKCEVAFVPRSEFISFVYSKPEVLKNVLDYFTTTYTASMIRISALEQAKAREKLLYTLYYLCHRHGTRVGSTGIFKIGLALTHQAIASLVGLTRETTATEMNKLRKEKILRYNNQQYSVDREKLLLLIGEESFRDIGAIA